MQASDGKNKKRENYVACMWTYLMEFHTKESTGPTWLSAYKGDGKLSWMNDLQKNQAHVTTVTLDLSTTTTLISLFIILFILLNKTVPIKVKLKQVAMNVHTKQNDITIQNVCHINGDFNDFEIFFSSCK